ncbi:hypothetical protein MLD38_009776 [Melastoma candidum]|uniref:Uncharacterized protein n=1 Tax=Melastoma candidum TaxID=119954 RepID=A0ACB9RZX8_9MYRT|nr:hypothetical protein MLD38_009776 [Melastoma candidum]
MRLSLTSDLVFMVLRACSRCGTESFCFFNWARVHQPASCTPTSIEYEEMVKILAWSKKYESMWKVIQEMKNQNLGLSAEAVCGIIEEFGRHGLTDQAAEVFNKCRHFDCTQTIEVYNSLLFALCKVKMFHAAYALIGRMIWKKVIPDKRTYAWCSWGKMREAQEFLEDMSRKGFNPLVRSRDLLIEGLLNAGYLESAKEMVRKLTKEGFVPDVSTFNSLMEAVCKSGEVDFCLSLHYKACKLGLCPDINTYKLLIRPVSKAGLIDEAFKLLNNSIKVGHKPFPCLYAPIIKGNPYLNDHGDSIFIPLAVSTSWSKALADEYDGIRFLETSAETNLNVEKPSKDWRKVIPVPRQPTLANRHRVLAAAVRDGARGTTLTSQANSFKNPSSNNGRVFGEADRHKWRGIRVL